MFPQLNFPEISLKLKRDGEKVYFFDPIRKKDILLTPEEWVRQHIVAHLISQQYPKGLINLESGLRVNSLLKRSDIIVRKKDGSPFLLIECKAPNVKLNQKVVEQATVYNKSLSSHYIAVTNGLQWCCFHMDYEKHAYTQIDGIPEYTNQ